MIKFDEIKSRIEEILGNDGYKIDSSLLPDRFTWNPDIRVKKGEEAVAILIRLSDEIPENLVQRMSSMRLGKFKLKSFIVFCKKPKEKLINLIKLYGINVKLLTKNRLSDIKTKEAKIKKQRTKEKKPLIPKMPRTDIFVSSQQRIKERQKAKEIIGEFFPRHKFPFNAILVEEDSNYTFEQTPECINNNLSISELFLGILSEEYRKWVDKEIRKVFNLRKPDEIIIFINASQKCKKNWNELIDWMHGQKSVKYQEYTDILDFERKLDHCLMLKAKKIHEDLGIPFYAI